MSWAKVSDVMPSHPKLVAAGFGALGLYTAGLCYARRHRTDGTIPTLAALTLDPTCGPNTARRLVAALVRVGLWEVAATDYRIHDWLDWNDPAEVVKAREAANRERVRGWRERNPVRNELHAEERNAVRNEVRTTLQAEDVTLYVPTPRAGARVIETETETETETESTTPPTLSRRPPSSGGLSRVSSPKPKTARKFSPAPKPGKTEKARGGFGTRRPQGKPEPPPASAAAVALAATYRRLFAARFSKPAPPGERAAIVLDELLTTYTADELEPLLTGYLRNGTRWAREQHAWSIDGFRHELPTLISLQSKGDL